LIVSADEGSLQPGSPIETLRESGIAEPCTASSNSGLPGFGIARSSFLLRKPTARL
jgi:hypothetical protein